MKRILLSLAIIAAMSLGAVHAQDTKTKKETPKTEQPSSTETEQKKEGCCKDKRQKDAARTKKKNVKKRNLLAATAMIRKNNI